MSSIEEKMIKTPAYIFKNDSKISLSEESKVYLST